MPSLDTTALRTSALTEEVLNGMAEAAFDVLARMSPGARLRLLAFLHLSDRPEAIRADLSTQPSGSFHLILSQAGASGGPADRADPPDATLVASA